MITEQVTAFRGSSEETGNILRVVRGIATRVADRRAGDRRERQAAVAEERRQGDRRLEERRTDATVADVHPGELTPWARAKSPEFQIPYYEPPGWSDDEKVA